MAIINSIVNKAKKTPKKVKSKIDSFENSNEIKKLKVYVVIVNHGQGRAISSLLQKCGSPAQYIMMGTGTANRQVLDILGIEDNEKDVIFSLIKEDLIPDTKNELEAYFASSKKNKGIGFTIKMTGIIGVKFYRFIANAL